MGFLSKLGTGLKNAFNNIVSSAKTAFTPTPGTGLYTVTQAIKKAVSSTPAQRTASALDSFSQVPVQTSIGELPATTLQSPTSQSTPAAILPSQPFAGISYYNPSDVHSTSTPGLYLPNPGTNPVVSETNFSAPRASTGYLYKPAPIQGGYVAPSSGEAPTGSADGNFIPYYDPRSGTYGFYSAKEGAPAVSGGTGKSGEMLDSTPMLSSGGGDSFRTDFYPSSGVPGVTGGGSNFTGLLGATGGVGNANSTSVTAETLEARRKRLSGGVMTLSPNTPGLNKNVGDISFNGSGLTMSPDMAGLSTVISQQPKFSVGGGAGAIDIANAKTVAQNTSNLSNDQRTGISDQIKTLQEKVLALKSQGDSQNPIPDKPIVDTQDQLNFLKQQPIDIQKRLQTEMDAYRESLPFSWTDSTGKNYTGLPALEAQRIDVLRSAEANNNAYNAIIKDMRENPNLPKGLGARRIAEFTRANEIALKSYQAKLDIISQQIKDANDSINEHWGIVKEAQTRNTQNRNDAQQLLNAYIQTGAVKNLSDDQILQLAQATGYSTDQIKALKSTPGGSQSQQQQQADIDASQAKLLSSRGKDGFVDPSVYQNLRLKALVGPDEFDKRFGFLLSSKEQKNIGITSASPNTARYLGKDYLSTLLKPDKRGNITDSNGNTYSLDWLLNYIETKRGVGYSDAEIEKSLGI